MKAQQTFHGHYNCPLYKAWRSIKQRVFNKKDRSYKNYGGRGIGMSKEWSTYFMSFYDWAMDNGYKKGLQIDREDNDDGYYPYNCRFVTGGQNVRNQRLLHSANTSGYRGVCKTKKRVNPYRAAITINNVPTHLGYFDSPVLAALRYDAEAYRLQDGRPTNFLGRIEVVV